MLADKMLVFVLLAMGFHLYSHHLHVIGVATNYPMLISITVSLPMLQGVLTFIYVSILISKNQELKWHYFLHTIPYFGFSILTLILVLGQGSVPAFEVIPSIVNEYPRFTFTIGILNHLLGPIYMVLALIKLKKHKVRIGRNFSYTEEIDLKWLKIVIYMMIVVWAVVLLSSLLSEYIEIIGPRFGDDLIYITLSIAVFIYGFFGIRQQVIYSALPVGVNNHTSQAKQGIGSSNQYKKSGLKKEESELHLKQLLDYMEDETPYLNGKLSLNDVAIKLDISTNYLSQVINENLEKNFFDFINSYRVDLVKLKMDDPSNSNFSLLGIAFDCGFNSKSSFNAIFKKHSGLTPTEYLKSIQILNTH